MKDMLMSLSGDELSSRCDVSFIGNVHVSSDVVSRSDVVSCSDYSHETTSAPKYRPVDGKALNVA